MRTLIVAPSEAELAATKRQQEEATAKKKSEEEAAANKKKEEAKAVITGNVSLDGSTIAVQSSGVAQLKLTCTGTDTCAGKLTLTAKKKGRGKKKAKTETIGTATFSIPAGKTATIELELNAVGRTLLGVDHGRLSASLTVLQLEQGAGNPNKTHTESVQLVQQKAHGKAKKAAS